MLAQTRAFGFSLQKMACDPNDRAKRGTTAISTKRRTRMLSAFIASMILLTVTACTNFRTDCLEKDAFCDGLSAWLAYQSVTPIMLVGDSVGQIHVSYDGFTWRSVSISGGLAINDVTFANGRFWAVTANAIAQGRVYYSEDGLNWLSTTNGISGASALSGIAFGRNGFVVTSELPGTLVHNSSDGINWIPNSDPGLALFDFSGTNLLNFSGGRFLVGDASGGNLVTSADGSIWTAAIVGVALAQSPVSLGSAVFWSDSGSHYATETLPGPLPAATAGLSGIRTGASNERADVSLGIVAGDNAAIHSSTDGINWSANLNAGGGAQLTTVTIEDPRFMLAGGVGGVYYLSTSRGATWQGPFTISGAGDLRASVTRPGFPFQ